MRWANLSLCFLLLAPKSYAYIPPLDYVVSKFKENQTKVGSFQLRSFFETFESGESTGSRVTVLTDWNDLSQKMTLTFVEDEEVVFRTEKSNTKGIIPLMFFKSTEGALLEQFRGKRLSFSDQQILRKEIGFVWSFGKLNATSIQFKKDAFYPYEYHIDSSVLKFIPSLNFQGVWYPKEVTLSQKEGEILMKETWESIQKKGQVFSSVQTTQPSAEMKNSIQFFIENFR